MRDVAALLEAYDAQLRAHVPSVFTPGMEIELDGPVMRIAWPHGRGFVGYRSVADVGFHDLDALIARQVTYFSRRGQGFEWKFHGHDLPENLPQILVDRGLVAEEQETVMIAEVGPIAADPVLPDGVTLREVHERADFERIAEMEEEVWHDGQTTWLPTMLEEEHDADPRSITIVVAEAEGRVVCAGWVRFELDTEFATLWGGSTLAAWRGRGIYKATVAYRAQLAAARGFRYLEVDASDESRPILERLGFVAVTTTTPYTWKPRQPIH